MFRHALWMTAVGFEPTPLRTGALSQRLRPLGQTVLFKVSRHDWPSLGVSKRSVCCKTWLKSRSLNMDADYRGAKSWTHIWMHLRPYPTRRCAGHSEKTMTSLPKCCYAYEVGLRRPKESSMCARSLLCKSYSKSEP